MSDKKILMVASPGGHFVQLSLIAEALSNYCNNFIIVGIYESKPSFIKGDTYRQVSDFSRDNPAVLFKSIKQAWLLLREYKPDLVITTGAAPGFVFIAMSKILGIKAAWVDSIANSRKLSLSGRLAKLLGVYVLTQWQNVASNSSVLYKGRVI